MELLWTSKRTMTMLRIMKMWLMWSKRICSKRVENSELITRTTFSPGALRSYQLAEQEAAVRCIG